MDDDEELHSPLAARGKRSLAAKQVSYTEPQTDEEEGNVPQAKRVKVEPSENLEDTTFGVSNPFFEETEEI